MAYELSRQEYAARYGPTTGDRVRLNRSTRHWDTAISAKARVLARFTSRSVRILCGPV